MRRLVALLLVFLTLVDARRYIKTSALLPCTENSQFSAKKFDVTFDADTKKLGIDAQLVSAIDGNFTIKAELLVYGISVLTRDISGCDLSKTVCPIGPGKFDVEATFTVPEQYIKDIPGIAYSFPDIDAVIRARVYYVDSGGNIEGGEIACVEAQLSNGKTVQHQYVSWIIFGIIALGVFVAAVTTLLNRISTAGHIISNVVSLFTYFQGVAAMAMMAVNRMPPIAAAWAQNFEWTMGIISQKSIQEAITWYVRSTGGTPTNILPNKDIISIAVYKRQLEEDYGPYVGPLVKRVSVNSNSTTTDESNPNLDKTLVLQGIKRVSYLANIELSNFFATGAAFFIFVGLALVFVLALVKGILELFILMGSTWPNQFDNYRVQWRAYTKGVMFRYFLVGFTQLSVLCLWELTNRVSIGTTVDACVMYAVLLVCLIFAVIKVGFLARKSKAIFQNPAYILYGNPEILNRWGFLYVQFRADAYWFLTPLLTYAFVNSAVIAFGQANGKVQSVIVFAVNLVYLVLISWVRPYLDKKTNGFNIAIVAVSFVNSIFFMFYSQIFGAKVDVAASIMGIVYFILNAVVSLILLIMIIVACLWALLHPDPDTRYEPVKDDRHMFIPDGPGEKDTELDALGDTARDGWRESYLNYPAPDLGHNDYERLPGASATDLTTPDPRVHQTARRETLSGYDDETWPTYRDFQSTGVMGQPIRSGYTDQISDRLVDHEDEAVDPLSESLPSSYHSKPSDHYYR